MSTEVETKKDRSKTRIILLGGLALSLVALAIVLALGFGGQLVGDYNKRFWIVPVTGTAESEQQVDPHIQKVTDEYSEFLEGMKLLQPDGVFEQVSVGDYEYPTITEDSLGQYTVNTFFFYENKETANQSYNAGLSILETYGYKQDPEIENSDTSSSLVRTFVPTEENSVASPGLDKISYTTFTRESGVTVIIFMYQSTELPLANILKTSNEEYTVQSLKDYEQKVFKGEIDGCSLAPNGAVGGWHGELKCFKEDL